jgi:hypothetical protein
MLYSTYIFLTLNLSVKIIIIIINEILRMSKVNRNTYLSVIWILPEVVCEP